MMKLHEFIKQGNQIVLNWEQCINSTSTIKNPEDSILNIAKSTNDLFNSAIEHNNCTQDTESTIQNKSVTVIDKNNIKLLEEATPKKADEFIANYNKPDSASFFNYLKHNVPAEMVPKVNKLKYYFNNDPEIKHEIITVYVHAISVKDDNVSAIHDIYEILTQYLNICARYNIKKIDDMRDLVHCLSAMYMSIL